jgi:hypothetical protein
LAAREAAALGDGFGDTRFKVGALFEVAEKFSVPDSLSSGAAESTWERGKGRDLDEQPLFHPGTKTLGDALIEYLGSDVKTYLYDPHWSVGE